MGFRGVCKGASAGAEAGILTGDDFGSTAGILGAMDEKGVVERMGESCGDLLEVGPVTLTAGAWLDVGATLGLVPTLGASLEAGLPLGDRLVPKFGVSLEAGLPLGDRLVPIFGVSLEAGLPLGDRLVPIFGVSLEAGLILGDNDEDGTRLDAAGLLLGALVNVGSIDWNGGLVAIGALTGV